MKSKDGLACASWLAALAIVILLLTGCGGAQSGAQPNGLHIHSVSSSIDWSTHLCVAYLAADAGIAGLGPSHWNTSNGSRPAADEQTIVMSGYAIYTPIQFSSMHILRDQRNQPTIEFDMVGGQVGLDSYSGGYPQMTPGGRYLLAFVPGVDPIAHAWNETVMIAVAAWPIDAQDVVTLVPEHTEGKGQQSEIVPAVTMPFSQLTEQLAHCKQ